RQERHADRVGVLLERGLGDVGRCLEEARVHNFEPAVAEAARDHLRSAIMPVQPGFGDDDAVASQHRHTIATWFRSDLARRSPHSRNTAWPRSARLIASPTT